MIDPSHFTIPYPWGALLRAVGDTHVFPAQGGLAVLAVDVGHGVQTREQDPLLGGATAHVHPEGEGHHTVRGGHAHMLSRQVNRCAAT